jgi:hypothetical protein
MTAEPVAMIIVHNARLAATATRHGLTDVPQASLFGTVGVSLSGFPNIAIRCNSWCLAPMLTQIVGVAQRFTLIVETGYIRAQSGASATTF